MVSHKTVKLVITTGDPIDFSKLAKKESMDNVERWIVSISHTVRMIDFHQQEYRNLHERHLNGKLQSLIAGYSISHARHPCISLTVSSFFSCFERFCHSRHIYESAGQVVVVFGMRCRRSCFWYSSDVY